MVAADAVDEHQRRAALPSGLVVERDVAAVGSARMQGSEFVNGSVLFILRRSGTKDKGFLLTEAIFGRNQTKMLIRKPGSF